jgi:hypothetical protein
MLWGFGLENVQGATARDRLLGAALERFGVRPEEPVAEPPPPPPPVPPQPPAPPAGPAAPVKPKLVVGSRLRVDRHGRTTVRVDCAARCSGVVKLVRGRRTLARATCRRSGVVKLKLRTRATRATIKLYSGSGRRARLIGSATVVLRRA